MMNLTIIMIRMEYFCLLDFWKAGGEFTMNDSNRIALLYLFESPHKFF